MRLSDKQRLTPRETQVHELVCAGLGNKEIARRMSIGYTTVRNHRQRILKKTGARNAVQLLRMSIELQPHE